MEILKNKDLSTKIINHFSNLTELPVKGFLSGGAVANYILELEWGGSYPINDLDVFIEMKYTRNRTTPDRSQELILVNGYNYCGIEYDYNTRYQITDVEVDNLLNKIYVQKYNYGNKKDYMYILKGFDLNCCQVGIDLETSKLIYTSEFEEFLRTKQLKVTGPYTPPHTAVRLFKKMEELKCFCDIESEMKLLSQAYHFHNSIHVHCKIFGLFFGIKYKNLYEKYEDKIKPYFKLYNFSEFKELMWKKSNELVTFNDNVNNEIPDYLYEDWSYFNNDIWGLFPVKYDKLDDEILNICGFHSNPLMLMSAWNLIYSKHEKSIIRKAKISLSGKYTKNLTLLNLDFVNCDFDRKSVDEFNKFCMYNFNLTPIIYKLKINLQQSIRLQKDLKKIINKEGIWYEERLFRILGNITDTNNLNYEYLVKTLETEKETMNKPLFEPINLENFYNEVLLPKNVVIKQINTECDLAWAGKKLNNCLNNPGQNYIDKLKNGYVKIFVLISDNSMSAVEFHVGIESYKEKQLLSYCNKIPSDYHRHIANLLKTFLTIQKMNEHYENKLNSLYNFLDDEQGKLFCCDDKSTENNETGTVNFDEMFDDDEDYNDEDVNNVANIYYPNNNHNTIHNNNNDDDDLPI